MCVKKKLRDKFIKNRKVRFWSKFGHKIVKIKSFFGQKKVNKTGLTKNYVIICSRNRCHCDFYYVHITPPLIIKQS